MANSMFLYVRDRSFRGPLLEFICEKTRDCYKYHLAIFVDVVATSGNWKSLRNITLYLHDRKMFHCFHMRSRVC